MAANTGTVSGVTQFSNWTLAEPSVTDLAITVSDGLTSVETGQSLIYTITATNNGPEPATGAIITDSFPPSISCPSWTCAASRGGSCTGAGSGGISDAVVSLPSGASAVYTANCSVGLIAAGNVLANTATISLTAPASATDPNPTNNSATDTDALVKLVNVAIENSDGTANATAGGTVAYQILVSNAGPNTATTTTTDAFPATLVSCSWTCAASAGSVCTASGSGNISDDGTVLAGGTLTYGALCHISPTATGTLVNTASVVVPAALERDTTPGNNAATDTDTVGVLADVPLQSPMIASTCRSAIR